GAMNVTSTAGDIISNNTTVDAGGGASLTGVGVSLGSLNSGGTLLITAAGPTSATDPLAGEVEVAEAVQGNGADNGAIAAVTIQAYDSITIPNASATAGSLALTATHGNIGSAAIPMSLTALDNITTTAGGTTSLGGATATNGAMAITSVGTISFSTLIASETINVTSTDGDIISNNTTVNAGGGATLTGVGVSLGSLTSGGDLLIIAKGPTSADPLAGEVEVAGAVQGNGADDGAIAAVTIQAYDSITIPNVSATAGSLALTATHGNIGSAAIPMSLTALDNITTTAGGTTSLGGATATNGAMAITSVGTISFSTLIASETINVTSTDGDIISNNTTVNAGGGATLTGVGVSLGSLTSGGDLLIIAKGPTSADPLAGEVEVAGAVQGNGADNGAIAAVTIQAYDSITIPNVSASAGSIALTAAHGNIGTTAIPMSLAALDNITTTAGGTTSLGSATATNGTMNITSVGTISFTTLISGGAMNVTSTAGDIVSANTTVTAGGGATLTGVGVSLGSLTAGGRVLIQAVGPTSAADPIAGEVAVAQFIQSNGSDSGTMPALPIEAYDAITIPSVAASTGSVSLAAGGNIAISTLSAL